MNTTIPFNGNLFRTADEARWAAFFIDLGIHTEYDPTRWCLPTFFYTPDFFLPQQHIWVDVQPTGTKIDPAPYLALAAASTRPVFCITGTPWAGCYTVSLFSENECYPSIRFGLFAEHVEKRGYWIAERNRSARFRKVFVKDGVDRAELIVHSERILLAMRRAQMLFSDK